MWRYVVKRILLSIFTIFLIVALTFFLMNAVPGGPFNREKALSPEIISVLKARYGIDKPVGQQFLIYLENIVTKGDFGVSIINGREVTDTILTGFKVSGVLGIFAIIISLVLGLFFGMIAALNRNRWPDRVIIFFVTLFVSVPSFVLALFLLIIFCNKLNWLPIWTVNFDWHTYILPIISLALYPMSYITRLTKSSMLDVLNQDYIRTARAKGVPWHRVVSKHTLRNGILPIITYAGPMTAFTLVGSLVVETVFSQPGLGLVFIDAINSRDYPMIMGTTIFLAVIMVIMTLLSDLAYKIADPRITFD